LIPRLPFGSSGPAEAPETAGSRMPSVTLLALLAAAATVYGALPQAPGKVIFAAHQNSIGVYTEHNGTVETEYDGVVYTSTEHLLDIIHAGNQKIARTISKTHPVTFVLRSDDLKFRAKIKVEYQSSKYQNPPDRPWTMTFQNLRTGAGEKPIELVHPGVRGNEFVWIRPGQWVTHSVASPSEFTLREDGKLPRKSMTTLTFVLEDRDDL